MNTLKKLVAATLIAGVSGVALAATQVDKASVEKSALTAHPGTVQMAKEIKKQNKDVWEVKIKGTDGKQYTMYFDAKSGNQVTF